MKKLFLTLVAVAAFSTVTFAQKANIESLKAAYEKAKEASVNPKKASKGATWIALGTKLNDLATANSSSIFANMDEQQIVLLLGKPGKDGEYETATINGVEYKKFVYPSIDLYLQGDKLSFWDEKEPAYAPAIEEAIAAFQKAIEIDAKSTEKAVAGLTLAMNTAVNSGNNNYMMNKFEEAAKFFSQGADIAKIEAVNSKDADMYAYYAGVANAQGGKNEEALKVFESLKANKYFQDGDVYYYLGYVNENLKNNAAAEEAYVTGVNEYPSNQKIMNQLINFYIISGDNPEKVIPYIKKAQAADPKNYIMQFVEGIAYQNMKEYDKAHDAYKRTIDINPSFFDVYYNDALVYIAQADAKIQDLNKIDTTNRTLYDKTLDEAIEYLKQALSVCEKGYEVDGKSKNIIELLKSTSFRLRDVDAKYLEMYNKYNDMLKSM